MCFAVPCEEYEINPLLARRSLKGVTNSVTLPLPLFAQSPLRHGPPSEVRRVQEAEHVGEEQVYKFGGRKCFPVSALAG